MNTISHLEIITPTETDQKSIEESALLLLEQQIYLRCSLNLGCGRTPHPLPPPSDQPEAQPEAQPRPSCKLDRYSTVRRPRKIFVVQGYVVGWGVRQDDPSCDHEAPGTACLQSRVEQFDPI